MIRPKRILEIGTYTGYASLSMAEGLDNNGMLITIDKNEELEPRVRDYFSKSSFEQNIRFIVGNAIDIIPGLHERWDLVFIDADKKNYINYYGLVIDQINPGGFIVADNVLWSGKVTDPSKDDEDTQQIRAFNDMVQKDPRVENILLPVRDGLMIMRKL
jgi:predicted O-methyltransferase YrrM